MKIRFSDVESAFNHANFGEIPCKNDLDLGSRFVLRFVRDTFPDGYETVRGLFSRRGAYARYKDWLITNDLLEKWYEYSNAAEEKALREWCADNGIELEEMPLWLSAPSVVICLFSALSM